MKIKKLFALAVAMLCTAGMWAQTDVTSQYLTNAGFDTESDFQTGNVATGGSNQRKAVTGWTNSGGDTYTTGAAIGFGTSGQINGADLPSENADGGTTGGALTLNAAWQSQVWYAQEITLPAGNYTFKFMVNNVGKNAEWNNDPPLFSFTTASNTFAGNVNSYPVNTWTEQTISFALATETAGTVKIGYKANNTGSGNTPKFVVDYVKAFYNSNYTATLKSAIDRATRLYNRLNDSDLNNAISAAQSVLDGAGTDVAYQATIDAAVTTLRSAIATAQAKFVPEGEEDITFLLENANFESSTPITGGICTYAYDCAKNGVFYSQMQQVEGWEVVGNDNGKAAGVFAFGSDAWLANESYTAASVTSSIGENNALALVGAWSGTVRYKQAVTLPAGVYVLTVPVFNSNGGTAISKNLIGFVTDGGTEYLASTTQYPVGSTKTESINFTLDEETTGYISLGYTAAGTGSGNCPKMFIDAITIKYFTADKSALFDEIAKAQTYQAVLNNSDLAAAITTAQGVYDNTQALQAAVDAQVTALETAISNALQNIASGTDVTSLFVVNNSFEEGNAGWTWNTAGDTGVKENAGDTYGTDGGDGNYLFNTWGGSDAKYVKQTLTNLPDGFYVVSALVASDANNVVTLYAGEGSNVAVVSPTGKAQFVSGLSGVGAPAEGNMEIGASSTDWYKADNFRLTYYATEAEALAVVNAYNLKVAKANLATALAAAQAAPQTESELLKQLYMAATETPQYPYYQYQYFVLGSEAASLAAAAQAAQSVDANSVTALQEATTALTTATATYLAAATSYERVALTGIIADRIGLGENQQIVALKAKVQNTSTVAADAEADANTVIKEVLTPAMTVKVDIKLGFEKDEYAPYNNVELLQIAVASKEIGEDPANHTNKEIIDLVIAYNNKKPAAQNTEDVDAIYNGMFATVAEGANYPDGWTRTNGWGQMQSGIEGDYATAYYNQPGSLQYGNQGVYTMPLAANTVYKFTFAYRSHENNSNNGVTVTLKKDDYESSKSFAANGSTTNWATGTAYLTTQEAGDYVLTLANSGNTWMTNVSLVKAAAEDVDIVVTDAEWGTMIIPFNAAVPQGLTVYSADAVDSENNIQMTEQDEIVANTPYIVKGKGTYNFNGVSTNNETSYKVGLLTGVYAETDAPVGSYVLQNLTEKDGVAFYVVEDGAQPKVKANRAYLTVPAAGGDVKAFLLGEGTNAIETVNAKTAQNGAIYNIAGQRVEKAVKGLYIMNGKKVLVK